MSSFPPTSILNTRLRMNYGVRLHTHRFTAFQTIESEMSGTMCVKLKPESMTNMHSGGEGASPLAVLCGAVNNEPWGISDAAAHR